MLLVFDLGRSNLEKPFVFFLTFKYMFWLWRNYLLFGYRLGICDRFWTPCWRRVVLIGDGVLACSLRDLFKSDGGFLTGILRGKVVLN